MSKSPIIQKLEARHIKADTPKFEIGDTVKVHMMIKEGNKERIQVFQGTVISMKGSGLATTFSVHRIAYGVGMERVFYLHSPSVHQVEVVRKGKVCRAKLYYLRGKTGKKARVRAKV